MMTEAHSSVMTRHCMFASSCDNVHKLIWESLNDLVKRVVCLVITTTIVVCFCNLLKKISFGCHHSCTCTYRNGPSLFPKVVQGKEQFWNISKEPLQGLGLWTCVHARLSFVTCGLVWVGIWSKAFKEFKKERRKRRQNIEVSWRAEYSSRTFYFVVVGIGTCNVRTLWNLVVLDPHTTRHRLVF
jgi:hypothetical protein